MNIKTNLTELFNTEKPVNTQPKEDVAVSGSDKYLLERFPCLENPKVLETYKNFVLHAGRCPECNDHLFPEITLKKDGSYKVMKKCMDRNCNYELDVSEDFNNHLGIRTPIKKEKEKVIKNPPSVYWNSPAHYTQSEDIRQLSEAIGECPICHHSEFEISVKYQVEIIRYEALAVCKNCNCVFDVTDFAAVICYKDFPEILQRDYNVTGWKDCKMRFLRKNNFPRTTGVLKDSVGSALDRHGHNDVYKRNIRSRRVSK